MATEVKGTKNTAPAPDDQFGDFVEWQSITKDNEDHVDILARVPTAGTAALLRISAADKAKAVPYIRIWRVNRESNKQIGPEISTQFWQPPDFGRALGHRFGERPPASLESVVIKHVNPGGFILYRELDIQVKIHRPDAIFNNFNDQAMALSSLLTPGNVHVLRYGWQGGTNPMLSTGISDIEKEDELNPAELSELKAAKLANQEEPKTYKNVVPAKAEVRFTVTNYNFQITADNQIEVHIKAFEDGELNTRSCVFFNQRRNPDPPTDIAKSPDYLQQIVDSLQSELSGAIINRDITYKKTPDGPDEKISEQFVTFKKVLDTLFSDPLAQTLRALGYGHMHFWTGIFNKNAPRTAPAFGDQDLADLPIAEFQFRYRDVIELVNKIISSEGQITVYNMLKQLFYILSNPGIYADDAKPLAVSVPEMHLVPWYNPDVEGRVNLYLIDRKRYLTKISPTLNEHNMHKEKEAIINRADLPSFLQSRHVPLIELYKANSFLADARFDVVNDELMKSVLMLKSPSNLTRTEIAGGDQQKLSLAKGAAESSLLYRSAIKGELTMIGNFIYNIMGIMWIRFGIRAWDGFFYVLSKTDRVSRDGFITTLTVQAEGSNPLGANTVPSVTGKDWVRDKINKRAQALQEGLWKGGSEKPESDE